MDKIWSYVFIVLVIISGALTLPTCINYLKSHSKEVGHVEDIEHKELEQSKTAYLITYNLDGGVVANNPDNYTLFTETFVLNNPTKPGCEFIGWTGTELTTPLMQVKICKGSAGDLEFTANYIVNKLVTPVISFTNNKLHWQNDLNAKSYTLVINDNTTLSLTNNYISFEDFKQYLNQGDNTFKVMSIAEDDIKSSEWSDVYTYTHIVLEDNIQRNITDIFNVEVDKLMSIGSITISSAQGKDKYSCTFPYNKRTLTTGSYEYYYSVSSDEENNFLSMLQTNTYTVLFKDYSLGELLENIRTSCGKTTQVLTFDLTDKVYICSKGSDNKLVTPQEFKLTIPVRVIYSADNVKTLIYDGCNLDIGSMNYQLNGAKSSSFNVYKRLLTDANINQFVSDFEGLNLVVDDTISVINLQLYISSGLSYYLRIGIDATNNVSYILYEVSSSGDKTIVSNDARIINTKLNDIHFYINSDYNFTTKDIASYLAYQVMNTTGDDLLIDFSAICNIYDATNNVVELPITMLCYRKIGN